MSARSRAKPWFNVGRVDREGRAVSSYQRIEGLTLEEEQAYWQREAATWERFEGVAYANSREHWRVDSGASIVDDMLRAVKMLGR